MHILLSQFESIGLNKIVYDEERILRLCKRHKVKVFEVPMKILGWYGKHRGVGHIYLDARLRGFKKNYVCAHELGHHFMHAASYQNAAFFFCDRDKSRPSKVHFEAEAFATLCLIPYPEMLRLQNEEIEPGSFLEKVLKFRQRKIFEVYGV